MISARTAGLCRRCSALRRYFFCLAVPALGALPTLQSAAAQSPADRDSARIIERQVRITLDDTGDYRLIEALRVQPGDAMGVGALPLIALPEEATDLRGLGGDIAPHQVVRDGGRMALIQPIPLRVIDVAATYRLPRRAGSLVLRSDHPVEELVVFIDRGRVEARPDRSLAREGVVGLASQPYLKYVARQLPPGAPVRVGLASQRVGWRQRLAVLVASTLAVGAAATWIWRGVDRRLS